jgi:uncharacterized protein GlcG (DUF336 family)
MNAISLSAAQRVLDAVVTEATTLGIPVCIAITDPAGDPVLTARMDRAPRLSAQIALDKAWTVSSFGGMPTHLWWSAIADDPALVHGLTNTPRLTVFGGGVGLHLDGSLVGAIGVSGGSTVQDRGLAEAGAAVLGKH